MKFNYENIYLIKRVQIHEKYVSLILHSLFDFLYDYGKEDLIFALYRDQNQYPKLISHYITWLDKYAYIENYPILKEVKKNKKALLEAFLKRFTPDFTKDLTVQAIENTKIWNIIRNSKTTIIHII